MAIKQNLPPDSQQWVRDIESRIAGLERENTLLRASVTQNAGQVGALGTALYQSAPITLGAESAEITLTGSAQTLSLPLTYTLVRGSARARLVIGTTLLVRGSSVNQARGDTIFWLSSSAGEFEPRTVTQRTPITTPWGPDYNVLLSPTFDIVTALTEGSTLTLNASITATSVAGSLDFIASSSLAIYPETKE